MLILMLILILLEKTTKRKTMGREGVYQKDTDKNDDEVNNNNVDADEDEKKIIMRRKVEGRALNRNRIKYMQLYYYCYFYYNNDNNDSDTRIILILASIMGIYLFDTYERHQPLTRHEKTDDYECTTNSVNMRPISFSIDWKSIQRMGLDNRWI